MAWGLRPKGERIRQFGEGVATTKVSHGPATGPSEDPPLLPAEGPRASRSDLAIGTDGGRR